MIVGRLGLLGWAILISTSLAADEPATKHLLRYKFRPGETIRWEVTHRSSVRTAVSGESQLAETVSLSTKVWRVKEVAADGRATFEHQFDDIDMRQKLSGREPVRYNSRTDKSAPPGFQDVAKSVGVPLSVMTVDARGKLVDRKRLVKSGAKGEGEVTITLPEEPIPVGHTWTLPGEAEASLPGGRVKKVQLMQNFTLASVKNGVATIRLSTRILTPIHDAAIEAQLVQLESTGVVRFDVDAGRILDQQTDVDKQVVGFRGEASSIHYVTRFNEKLLPAESVAAKPAERK